MKGSTSSGHVQKQLEVSKIKMAASLILFQGTAKLLFTHYK